jgi:Na+/proline symporter
MNVWFPFIFLVVMGIIHAVVGSIVVSGMYTIASIFVIVLDVIKEDIIKVIKQNKENK